MRFIERGESIVSKECARLYQVDDQYVLLEPKNISVARIPVLGEKPLNCVYVHPRYVPKTVKHEVIEVSGVRRGRSLELLLETDDGTHVVLSVKGTGADADEEMVMHPSKWWGCANGGNYPMTWLSREKGDPAERQWGCVRKYDGELEMKRYEEHIRLLGIRYANQPGIVPVPKAVARKIQEVHGSHFTPSLVQVSRLARTNVRLSDLHLLPAKTRKKIVDMSALAEIDEALFSRALILSLEGIHLEYHGYIDDNRLITGEYIDAENLSRVRCAPKKETVFWQLLLVHHLCNLPEEQSRMYAEAFTSCFESRISSLPSEVLKRVAKMRAKQKKANPFPLFEQLAR